MHCSTISTKCSICSFHFNSVQVIFLSTLKESNVHTSKLLFSFICLCFCFEEREGGGNLQVVFLYTYFYCILIKWIRREMYMQKFACCLLLYMSFIITQLWGYVIYSAMIAIFIARMDHQRKHYILFIFIYFF